MRTRVAIRFFFILAATLTPSVRVTGRSLQSDEYGPEVKSFLEYLHHEDIELEFQIQRNEITRQGYNRAKNKIIILRQTVLGIVKQTGQDVVPELHVVASDELYQLIGDEASALKSVKKGEIVHERWRLIGKVSRGEVYYIFERLPRS